MTLNVVRWGRAALGSAAIAGLSLITALPAQADKVRIGVGDSGFSITVVDRDGHGRRGHGRRGYDEHNYGHGYGKGHHGRSMHDFHYRGWEAARHARYGHGGRCFPVVKRSYWRGRPALLGATGCYGRHGPYIVRRSVHLEHYLYGRHDYGGGYSRAGHGHYHGDKYCNVRH